MPSLALRRWFLASAALAAALAPGAAGAQVRRPVIERISPTAGPVGTEVEVVGRHFSGGMMFLGERQLPPVRQSPNRWTVRIPEDARTGRILVRTAGGSFRGPTFRVIPSPPAPTVTGIDPVRGRAGETVVVEGTNFSPRAGETTVRFGREEAVVRNATPTRLEVVVPEQAASGPISVAVRYAGEAESPQPFTVQLPTAIAALEPAVGPPGSEVTIRGTGFSDRTRNVRVLFDGRRARVRSASEAALVVTAPRNASTGPVVVDVRGGGRATSDEPFVVQEMPVLRGFTPTEALGGRRVTLRGRHFGDDASVVRVTLDGDEVPVLAARGNEVTVTIPRAASSGDLAVWVRGVGPATTGGPPFVVLEPLRLAEITPRNGPPGTVVALVGEGFSSDPEHVRVTMSGTPLPVVTATPTKVEVRIPEEAASGPLIVAVDNGGTGRSATPFLVTQPPVVAGFSPAQGMVGDAVTITGSHFGTVRNAVRVTIGDRPMRIRALADDRIEAEVPRGATSGRIAVSVRLQGQDRASTDFTVLQPFVVRSVDPGEAWPGRRITVQGRGFVAGTTVAFPGVRRPVTPISVADDALRVTIPPRARTGDLTVRVPDGRDRTVPLRVVDVPDGLAIVDVDAACRNPGCRVDVLGHGFGRRGRGAKVYWGDVELEVVDRSGTALGVELPETTGRAPFRVVVGDESTASPPFVIVP